MMMLLWGWYLASGRITLKFSLEDLENWSGWTILGIFLIITGVTNLIREALFAFRSLGSTSGEWHFSLNENHLIWNIPNHAHGDETGFNAELLEIAEIEYRVIEMYEELSKRECWVHFYARESIQLQSYSGLTLSSLVSKICNEGVECRETRNSE